MTAVLYFLEGCLPAVWTISSKKIQTSLSGSHFTPFLLILLFLFIYLFKIQDKSESENIRYGWIWKKTNSLFCFLNYSACQPVFVLIIPNSVVFFFFFFLFEQSCFHTRTILIFKHVCSALRAFYMQCLWKYFGNCFFGRLLHTMWIISIINYETA